mmetsp:Transcript_64418/g.153671  ORF Transcript_64418/g.153671 Transcript_64418/m.153671 type:complete len:692 (+) Transcript_64418:93-2168(+)
MQTSSDEPGLDEHRDRFEEILQQLSAEHTRQVESLKKAFTDNGSHAAHAHHTEPPRHVEFRGRSSDAMDSASSGAASPLLPPGMMMVNPPALLETTKPEATMEDLARNMSASLTSEDTVEVTHFRLLEEWTRKPTTLAAGITEAFNPVLVHTITHPLVLSEADAMELLVDISDKKSGCRRCKISPSDWRKLTWDMVGFFFVAYDFIFIPLQVFDVGLDDFFAVMNLSSLVFWTIDMFLCFITGFYRKGELVMESTEIVAHYVRTWFFMDVVVVLPDWVMLFLGRGFFSRLGRLFRAVRTLRILRLLRLMKLSKLMTSLYDMLGSEFSFLVASLTRLLLLILFLNHLIACTWYWIGTLGMDANQDNWIEHAGSPPAVGRDTAYKYTTALHWSMTQFTPAGMDVSARNVQERVFSVAVLFFAMVTFSSVIASVTNSMSALRMMTSKDTKQFWLLRRYLRQEAVNPALMSRILRYAEYQCRMKETSIQAGNITLLSELSYQLKMELAGELQGSHLTEHNFFRYLGEEMSPIMHRLCFHALTGTPFAKDDVVFEAEDESQNLFFVQNGQFRYTHFQNGSHLAPLRHKAWCSEPALWTTWQHCGALVAMTPGALIALPSKQFREVMQIHPRSWRFARSYGARFVKFLNHIRKEALTDVIYGKDILENVGDEDDPRRRSGSCTASAKSTMTFVRQGD